MLLYCTLCYDSGVCKVQAFEDVVWIMLLQCAALQHTLCVCARSCLLLDLVVMLVSFGMLVCVYFTTIMHDPYFTDMSFLLVYSHVLHK
jgi:hypothetical protein